MKRWAIAIGINQYQFFQPLSFAQQDAQAIQSFLVNEAGFSPEECLLLTDSSPSVWSKPTYPNRENIQAWLDLICQHYIQPGDLLWVFFSGYGVCIQGQDYWVPIDGSPDNLQTTAIPVEAIFSRLKAAATDSVLVLLDVSRSQSSLPNAFTGARTAQVAHHLGIPTILSCQPGQFSHEAAALGQGFFTAALLEGLRTQPFATLAGLGQYLDNRLPELSQQHWRPVQRSQIISPVEQQHQILLPPVGAPTAGWSFHDPETSQAQVEGTPETLGRASAAAVLAPSQTPPFAGNNGLNGEVKSAYANGQSTNGSSSDAQKADAAALPPLNPADTEKPAEEAEVAPKRSPLFWSGVTAASLLLITGVCSKHWASMTRGASVSAQKSVPSSAASLRPSTAGSTTVASLPSQATNAIAPKSTIATNIGAGGLISGDRPAQNQPSIAPTATQRSGKPLQPSSVKSTKAASIQPGVVKAQQLGTGVQKQSAGVTVKPKAGNIPSSTTAAPKSLAKVNRLEVARAKARKVVNSDQASPYWYAIQEASAIQPTDPSYSQAQQDIAGWSQSIFNIATRRAKRGNVATAIMAAALIPESQSIYPQSEKAIDRWCPSLAKSSKAKQSVRNRSQQRQAKAICQRV